MNTISTYIGKLLYKKVLSNFSKAGIPITTPDGIRHVFDNGNRSVDPIQVNDWSFFTDLVYGYDLGFAKSYIDGKWTHSDLTELFEYISITSGQEKRQLISKIAPLKIYSKIIQSFRVRNTRKQSRNNIKSHYDISNEFFSCFLDPSLTYSCAIYNETSDSLEEAQAEKINVMMKSAPVKADDHILDIGSGWGNLPIIAASDYGAKVSAITLSESQHNYSKGKFANLGLNDAIDIQLLDYRDLSGKYDHIFSVEMVEAIGHKGISDFFSKCATLLRTDGTLQLQVITIPDERYESYRKNCDFIQKYIFPGGLLLPTGLIKQSASDCGFEIYRESEIGSHYPKTLITWQKTLEKNRQLIHDLGFDDNDYRRFFYYFSYCAGAFKSGHISNFQFSFKKK